ncbi:MAG: hypothetical protein D3907_01240, partial [Candidatus Electrothrix sp. AUS3]|nr:hypothetical protein [Candidatus Electrothrix gigas]
EGNRALKSKLIDEVQKNTGMHRKSILRLMNKKSKPQFKRGKGKSINSYSDEAKKLLIDLWVAMGRLGAVRMKAAIPLWIGSWKHKGLDNDYVKFELKSMSASTIERALKAEKAKHKRLLNTGTKPSASKSKVAIPIRDLENQPTEVGHCEIDCVAHCGGNLSGNHAWTLTLTDIVSGTTANRAMESKNGLEVENALYDMEKQLPFKIKCLYMDNGSEFINGNLVNRFSKRINGINRTELIDLFRSRPYKKNDQCFVEQKNHTHVRELFGYDRIEGRLQVQLMNAIYRNEWFKLTNFFQPQIRLKTKERHGSKIKKTYYTPQTAFEALKAYLPIDDLSKLEERIGNKDPFSLMKSLKTKLRNFQSYRFKKGERMGKYDI